MRNFGYHHRAFFSPLEYEPSTERFMINFNAKFTAGTVDTRFHFEFEIATVNQHRLLQYNPHTVIPRKGEQF